MRMKGEKPVPCDLTQYNENAASSFPWSSEACTFVWIAYDHTEGLFRTEVILTPWIRVLGEATGIVILHVDKYTKIELLYKPGGAWDKFSDNPCKEAVGASEI